jgi:hypothetical protein
VAETKCPISSVGAPVGPARPAFLGSTEAEWTEIFAGAGKTYKPPTLVMFSGATHRMWFRESRDGPVLLPDGANAIAEKTRDAIGDTSNAL